MCRMILALGSFSTQSVLNAALSMSEGMTASHDGPICRHPNGWGALWRNSLASHGLSVHRDTRSIKESLRQSLLHEIETDFLTIHVRHATLAHNQGIECTHPITRQGMLVPWYLFHNGFLPTVYQKLGLERSTFDSGEYFDYIIPPTQDKFSDNLEIIKKLENLAPGGSSANAIVVNPKRAYVIHWTPKNTRFPLYFTMYKVQTKSAFFIASEIISKIAPYECWHPLTQGEIIELPLTHK
ncbi:class II glutamine amidotransferase [Nostoc sp. UIC 10630]|uniref:class II glutamine amidotransferase n=1 Tax=Nostoc sp. UIC 10630 TaxID=2100146 RepID=UPI001A9C5858|nr:class II glutamine amidotransferase [Nostoc sp. UIC 10630]